MSEGNITLTANQRHLIQLLVMAFVAGGSFMTLDFRVAAVEEDKDEIVKKIAKTDDKIEVLSKELNAQAVTIGGIVVTTKNIEKKMDTQQRLLERISEQLTRPPP